MMDKIKEAELRQELQELESKMQAAQAAMSELKQKIKDYDPEDEDKNSTFSTAWICSMIKSMKYRNNYLINNIADVVLG